MPAKHATFIYLVLPTTPTSANHRSRRMTQLEHSGIKTLVSLTRIIKPAKSKRKKMKFFSSPDSNTIVTAGVLVGRCKPLSTKVADLLVSIDELGCGGLVPHPLRSIQLIDDMKGFVDCHDVIICADRLCVPSLPAALRHTLGLPGNRNNPVKGDTLLTDSYSMIRLCSKTGETVFYDNEGNVMAA